MKTILLVDDEPELTSILAETLERAGYTVIPRPDAESALTVLLNRTSVDLVITDLQLPGMSGFELTEVLRKALPSVPVIMLTAYGSVESYIESRSMGVFEYINKPVQAKELRRIVKTALAESSAGHASQASHRTKAEMLPLS
jgi:DNA-binding NtrC family response regulator